MATVDWTRWLEISQEERDALVRTYRERIRLESDENAQRWNSMTPAQRARYPEAATPPAEGDDG